MKRLLGIILVFLTFLPFSSHSANESELIAYGTTMAMEAFIILTQHRSTCILTATPPEPQIGRVFHKNPIQFHDPSLNTTASFSTRFTIGIIPSPPPCVSGEGIAFLITSNKNLSAGSMGLPNSLDHSSSFFAVEFDTKFDKGFKDLNDNHLGINLDSSFSIFSVDLMRTGVNLKRETEINVWIEYTNPEKIVRVWVGYTQTKPENPSVVAPIDLSKTLRGNMFVGFSASNGREGSAVHFIESWHFKTWESVETGAVGPDNCNICFPLLRERIADPGHDRYSLVRLLVNVAPQSMFLLFVAFRINWFKRMFTRLKKKYKRSRWVGRRKIPRH